MPIKFEQSSAVKEGTKRLSPYVYSLMHVPLLSGKSVHSLATRAALGYRTTINGLPDQGTISNATKRSQQMSYKEYMPLRNHGWDTHLGHFIDKATKGTKVGEETLWGARFYVCFGK